MNAGRIGRFVRTISHLRAGQIAAQVRERLDPGSGDPSWVERRQPPPVPAVRWRPVTAWLNPDAGANTAAALHAGRFSFVNDERTIGWPPDWSAPGTPLLWRYNLHYLEWTGALPTSERLGAALDWARRHPPVRGAVGWAPYPTSLRLPTLCMLAAEVGPGELWPTLWRQAEHLSRRLERHLLGNHLLENGIALAFAGACFEGPDAERWLRTGLDVLREQLPEQILADGMHFERSPMYQTRLTHALALVANTGHQAVRSLVAEPLCRMRAALLAMCHPDGGIALFNDSAFGIYPEPAAVSDFVTATLGGVPAPTPTALPDAGYFVGRGPAGDALFCDAGPLGPDYLPGHAHGDIFSFELSLGGRRVVVDSGTYDYVPSEMRRHCRSTAAHNTVTVDDADQAEFWGAFRVGRRGRPRDVRHATDSTGFTLSGWHDGFRHLRHRPVHRRSLRWDDAGVLVVEDVVAADGPVRAATRIHLHPDCRIVAITGTTVLGVRDQVPFTVSVGEGPMPRVAEGWYCPRFGVRRRNPVLVLESAGAAVRFRYTVSRGHPTDGPIDERARGGGGEGP
jgi:uncharacterized heparinase superfamily protein